MNTMFAVEVESLPNPLDEEIHRACLYILCNPERRPVPGIMITGVGGDPNVGLDRWPFMINKDGRGDHGAGFKKPAERFFETNLRSKTMEPLELFTVLWADPEQPARQIETTFRIRSVTPIAGPSLQ